MSSLQRLKKGILLRLCPKYSRTLHDCSKAFFVQLAPQENPCSNRAQQFIAKQRRTLCKLMYFWNWWRWLRSWITTAPVLFTILWVFVEQQRRNYSTAKTAYAVDGLECGRKAPFKISYPHGHFSMPCFKLAIVPLNQSWGFPCLKLNATQQISFPVSLSSPLNQPARISVRNLKSLKWFTSDSRSLLPLK